MRKKRSFCFVKKWRMSLLCTFSHFFLVIESVAKPGGAHISQLVISIESDSRLALLAVTSATAAKCSASAATTSGVFSGAMGATPSNTGATGRVYS